MPVFRGPLVYFMAAKCNSSDAGNLDKAKRSRNLSEKMNVLDLRKGKNGMLRWPRSMVRMYFLSEIA